MNKRFRSNSYNDMITRLYVNDYPQSFDLSSITRFITFQVTNQCNLNCDYCYEHHKNKESMSLSTSKKIVDLIIKMWKDDKKGSFVNKTTKAIVLDFIGGEPLLEAKLIEDTIEYFLLQCAKNDCELAQYSRASICTNGQNFYSDEVQHLINRYGNYISLNVSIDGVKELHDAHRVHYDGTGSFDLAYKAFLDSAPSGQRTTKMTFVPNSFKYIFESIKFMLNNGVQYIACNYAYEPIYTVDDAKLLYKQLKLVSDYLIDVESPIRITMLDWEMGKPFSNESSDKNWCGGTGAMLSFAPNGMAYPCIRYAPISIGEEKSSYMNIGDYKGIYISDHSKKVKDYLDGITKISQSTKECLSCPVQEGCGWCSAYNYECGDVNKRNTNICEVHKSRVLSANRYHNKRYLALHDCIPEKIYLPESDALKIVSKEEWDEIKRYEADAIGEYNMIIDMFELPVDKIV